jgi:hypothetical protein
VADAIAIEGGAPASEILPTESDESATGAENIALLALMLLPGALILYTGFNAGGYFPQTPAIVALIATQILLLRVTQARHPFAGFGLATVLASTALAAFAALTLASALWSHSTGRALIAFDRVWMYLVLLVLFASVRPTPQHLRWLARGLVAGASVVCLAGLISRVAPDVWPTAPNVANERLSYPVTYWNALGLLATLAIVLAFHLTCTLTERRPIRVVAAALVPPLAATVFFTFSRGSMVAGAIGLVVYALVGRPRGLLSGILATVPASAFLVVAAYKANLLDTVDPTTPAAVSQGHRVALAAVLCVLVAASLRWLLAARLDPRLRDRRNRRRMSNRAMAVALLGSALAVVVLTLALSLPQRLTHDWHRFTSGVTPVGSHSDLRRRLTDASDNGRTELWRVAFHSFERSPLKGRGAGTYQIVWDSERPRFAYAVNAHSLYLEVMAELGLPGLLLLLLSIGAALVGMALRARGQRRSLYGALLAAGLVWALAAGVDWDWQMPVVTLGFFAIAGAALGPRSASSLGWSPGHGARLALGLGLLITLVLPVLTIGSQARLASSERALYQSNCAKGGADALSSIGWLDVRAEPYEVIGYCDLRRAQPRLAVSAMRQAVRYDPSWETYLGLAIAQASAGADPRRSAATALRMDRYEPLTVRAARALAGTSPTAWVSVAPKLLAAALASEDLSIRPS